MTPNWELMLWMMLCLWALRGILGVFVGGIEAERKRELRLHYDKMDIGVGFITIIVVILILLL